MDALPNCLGRFQSLKTVQIELCATRGPYAGDVLSFAALLDVAPLLESFFLKVSANISPLVLIFLRHALIK